MRARLTLLTLLATAVAASPALAHVGHIGEVAGHAHWIALGGIALAGAIALLGRRNKKDNDSAETAEPEDDTEEASA